MKKTGARIAFNDTSGAKRTLAGKERLREKVREDALKEKMVKRLSGKKCPPDHVLAYVINLGYQPFIDALGTHTRGCANCRTREEELRKGLAHKGSLDIAIPSAPQRDKAGISEDIITMIVKATRDYLELTKHTGEQVFNIPGIVGSIETKGAHGKTVIVRKDMPSHDLSVHLAMTGTANSTRYEARFCAMKPDIGEYIKNLNVSLTGESGDIVKRKTDDKGCVEFGDMKKGKYEIWSGDKLIASIVIE